MTEATDDGVAGPGDAEAAINAAKPEGITQIAVHDQNGDRLAVVDAGDAEHVHLTIGGTLYRISNKVARQLRNALHVFGARDGDESAAKPGEEVES